MKKALIFLSLLLILSGYFFTIADELQIPVEENPVEILPNLIPPPNPELTNTPFGYATQIPSLRPLADQKGIFFGTAVQSKLIYSDAQYNLILQREFNMITPEDEMKMCETWPTRGKFNF